MDFITHLPQSCGHMIIWVICDRLTKSVQFIGLPSHYTVADLARRFVVEIFRLYWFPKSIISYRDPLFMSKFWRELFKLRCFAGEQPWLWFHFLHLAEYWFNRSHHSAIGMTPLQAVYGCASLAREERLFLNRDNGFGWASAPIDNNLFRANPPTSSQKDTLAHSNRSSCWTGCIRVGFTQGEQSSSGISCLIAETPP